MAPVMAGVGLVLLVMGILAVAAGLGLMVFTQEDQSTSSEGFFAEADDGQDNRREGRVGQSVAVGGGALAFLGLVFIVIGRAD